MIQHLKNGASISLILLIFLCLAWELWLAPLKPGGSMLVLKTLPLLIPLFGILRGNRYTYQWTSIFIWLYFTEGVVRAWSETNLSSTLAMLEVTLCLTFFICVIYYAKLTCQTQEKNEIRQ
jgi:uncharacterized membrane protein